MNPFDAFVVVFLVLAVSCSPASEAQVPTNQEAIMSPHALAHDQARRRAPAALAEIAQADRLVVAAEGRRVTVTDAGRLRVIHEALQVTDASPSGGKSWAELTWYRGADEVHRAWVFPYGEWGLRASAGPSWTLGVSDALVTALKAELKGAP